MSNWIPNEFIIYDLEYTSWEGSKENGWSREGEYREIVDVGAIKVKKKGIGLQVQNMFSMLVMPKINPELSDYFIQLTGIKQERLSAEAEPFETFAVNFLDFCAGDYPIFAYGEDDEILVENHGLYHVPLKLNTMRFINYRAVICDALNVSKSVCSGDLPEAIGLERTSNPHRGLDDAMAQVRVLEHLISIEH